jgi:hypothetical protein
VAARAGVDPARLSGPLSELTLAEAAALVDALGLRVEVTG